MVLCMCRNYACIVHVSLLMAIQDFETTVLHLVADSKEICEKSKEILKLVLEYEPKLLDKVDKVKVTYLYLYGSCLYVCCCCCINIQYHPELHVILNIDPRIIRSDPSTTFVI